MKRCPACKRVEPDDALVFCRADGTPLVGDSGSVSADAGTAKFGSSPAASEIETSVLPHHSTDADMNRATGPTTVLDPQPTISRTRELGRPKRSKPIVFVAVVFIAAIAVSAYFYLSRKNRTAIESVAVLPFVNTNGDPNMEYLSDGLTESLIYNLSQLPSLRVIPRSSVFRYKGKDADPQIVSRELGARAVLEGRVTQHGEDLSISVELIDTLQNKVLWGQQYHRKLTDTLAMQQEISKEISERLRVSLSSEEERRLTKHQTESAEAYQAYLKGRYHWNKRTEAGIKKGAEFFQQAVDLDPTYALAYAGLADSYQVLPDYSATPARETAQKAKAAAARAIELDPNLAEAHTSLALIKERYDWDFAGAEREFKRAMELNPNYATAHQWYADLLDSLGRSAEARTEIVRAQQLEPLNLIISTTVGANLLSARQYDQAIEQDQRTLEMDPSFSAAHAQIARAYGGKGRYDEAIRETNKSIGLAGRFTGSVADLGYFYAKAGSRAEANKVVGELIERAKTEYVSAYDIATVYAGLGEKEKVFAWLEKAFQERSSGIVGLKVDLYWDSLRSDPRFTDLLRRIGLPQ